ncbi:hypothetical protein SLA2020_139230 [Shorea laevis]
MVEIMEEDTDLQNLNLASNSKLVGVSSQIKDPMGPSMPMEIVTPKPPLAPSTSFVKPKPRKRKPTIGGPILKDTKALTPKPYQLPPALNKQKKSYIGTTLNSD